MYVAIRRDRVAEPARQTELARRLNRGLAPLLCNTPGCVACHVVVAEDGSVVAIGLFRDRDGAETALRQAAAWAANEVAALVVGPPEVMLGEATTIC